MGWRFYAVLAMRLAREWQALRKPAFPLWRRDNGGQWSLLEGVGFSQRILDRCMDVVPAVFDIPLHGLARTRRIPGCDAFKDCQVLVACAFDPVCLAEI